MNARKGACLGDVDFVDAGMASTYMEALPRIAEGLDTLLGTAAEAGCRIALVELADGIFQRETAELLRSPGLRGMLDGVLFAAPDAASAAGGVAVLRGWGIEPDMVTGLLSRSPMASAEAAMATGLSVAGRADLCDPAFAGAFLAGLGARGGAVGGAVGRAAPADRAAGLAA